MKPNTGVLSFNSTAQRVTVAHAPSTPQAVTSILAESPTASHRVESGSHSMIPRFTRARVVTVSPRHVTVVRVVSIGALPGRSVARMRGWRVRTTARLPEVSTGAIRVMVGGLLAATGTL